MGTEGPTVLDRLWRGFPPLDPGTLSGSASCALPPRHEAVKTAREFTRSALGGWRLGGHFDNVALVVSELVTNALRHGLPSARATAELDPPIRLHLMHWSSRLVCAVRDPSEKAPVAGGPDFRPDVRDEFGGGFGGGCTGGPAGAAPDPTGTAGPAGGFAELGDCAEFADFAAESGRGLFLVQSFSDGWGWQPMEGSLPGKVVWALFRLNPGRGQGVSP